MFDFLATKIIDLHTFMEPVDFDLNNGEFLVYCLTLFEIVALVVLVVHPG